MATTITTNLINVGAKLVGDLVGNTIGDRLFNSKKTIYGKRIYHIKQQKTPEGESIPNIYGKVELAGTIIWISDINQYLADKTFSKSTITNRADYNYTISLAIGLCEGPISSIGRIWADGVLINKSSNIRVYYGDDNQEPDPLLEALYSQNAPAFRGLAYVMIQEFDITKFDNKVPNFTFEVSKYGIDTQSVEHLVESIVIIPGCGEFVYDTKVHSEDCGNGIVAINQHHTPGVANAVVSMEQLKEVFPKIKWVSPVVSWFGSSTNAGDCTIIPKIEKQNILYESEAWEVAGINRKNAEMMSYVDDQLNYGGTPSDNSIVRYLQHIQLQELEVMFYPMLFLDVPGKPWRGRIAPTSGDDVRKFFNGENGYNNFILHYANLVKNYVSAFLIGSEMQDLTRFKDENGYYVAVDELVKLAAEVKAILGDNVKVSYGANWGEYHSVNGEYYMDKLWASKDIDFVGIDAYFPLSNVNDSQYNVDQVIAGWDNGELYDYYNYKGERKVPLSEENAKKNIEFWWSNYHYNRDGTTSEWQPKMKKIWFTEYGFASIACATNEPNVFIDPSTSESNLPYGSNGEVDILAQRVAIQGTEMRWNNSQMIERRFLWTWDARPYPTWPQLDNIWSDGDNWQRGHWVNGKVGAIELREVVKDLCVKSGINEELLDVKSLHGIVHGMIIDGNQTAKSILSDLQKIYNFDVYEADGQIKCVSRYSHETYTLHYDNFLVNYIEDEVDSGDVGAPLSIEYKYDIPKVVSLHYITQDCTIKKYELHIDDGNNNALEMDLPTIMSDEDVKNVTQNIVRNLNDSNTTYDFTLAINSIFKHDSPASIQPGDLLKIDYKEEQLIMRVINIDIREDNRVHLICSKDSGMHSYNLQLSVNNKINDQQLHQFIPESIVEIIKIPSQSFIAVGASGLNSKWHGCKVDYKTLDRNNIITEGTIVFNKPMITGNVISFENHIKNFHFGIDNYSKLVVKLHHGQLFSIAKSNLFIQDKNLIIVGNEIMKFSNATLEPDGTYLLSGFLRGLYGTTTKDFNRFALLDMNALHKINLTNGITQLNLSIETFLDKKQLKVADVLQEKSLIIENDLLHPVRVIRDGNKISWTPRVITEDFFNNKVDHGFCIKLLDRNNNILNQVYTMDYTYEIPNNIYNDVTEIMIAAFQDNRVRSEYNIIKV